MAKRAHIIVAEPSSIIRCGLVTMLQRAEIFNIDIAESRDVSSLASMQFKSAPDILIVNPMLLGSVMTSQLRSELGNESLRIIAFQTTFTEPTILQSYDDSITIYESLESIKSKILAFIGRGVETEGDSALDNKKDLSTREKEIIVCVVKGMTNKVIAETLFLSTHTVIAHRRNIANKLQIFSPSGLTIYAIVNKLVDLSDVKGSISGSRE